MLSYSSFVYQKGPVWLQELIIFLRFSLRRFLREGRTFKAISDEITTTQWMNREELNRYQEKHLLGILRHAVRRIPFYKDQLGDRSADDTSGISLVSKFPLLEKKTVVEQRQSFVDPKFSGLKFKGATGGTTGLSMVGYRDLYSINFENAFLMRQLQWAGYEPGRRRAWLRGDMIVPPGINTPPYWRMNRADNMLMLSAYHLSTSTIMQYIQELEKFDPVIIQAYPSAVAYLAEHLIESNKKYSGKSLNGIVTSSESLLPGQRKSVEEAMGVRIFDWYGSFERTVAIGTCEHGSYHLLTDYSYVERMPVAGQQDTVELIGTGFGNRLMPLIRYRIGDSVIMADEDYQCPCGRTFPVVKEILGRVDDVVKTPDGKRIGMAINIFDGISHIIEGQLVQDALDELIIYLVVTDNFSEADETALLERAKNIIGPNVAFKIEVVAKLARTKNGKLRTVICNV